ncbi:FtsX-like permease family protein [Myxococcus sp. RHSTA-1-4]|uniref:ABC transporter permease n=1 Tax=Myxococcus sp. RHSTA-1-4 TaxID=2874601 RepID=UPI001CBBBD27|nr:FtsX-like permease family protein [Myxococcus sp. RHSTA-1-4]MBZ4419575.1 ABC transporter permease [Myxococcus sp. RHSTA-1-4]
MPFELFVALRFLREGRAQTALIFAGVSVGVAVIVFLSALIDGLQASLVERTLGSQPHIVVRAPEEAARPLADGPGALVQVVRPAQRLRTVEGWLRVQAELERTPGVVAVSPVVSGAGFASRGNASRSVAVRGVEAERFQRIIDVPSKLVAGAWRLQGGEAVIGQELAEDLGVSVGDRVRLTTAEGRADSFRVAGIFDLGNRDVNERWVLVPLRSAQTLLDVVGGVTSLEARVQDVFGAEALAGELRGRTGLVAESWMALNAQLLTALRSQSSSRYMIQFFVIVAVALGIASVLVVSVVQKSREIGILKAMGTPTRKLMRVFLLQGAVVGGVGSVLGSLLGVVLAGFFEGLARNPDGSPTFPVQLDATLFLTAAGVALLTGVLAAVAPARRAAKLDPAVVIRNG